MRKNQGTVKAELMKEAERLIDELLQWQAETEAPNLTQIEGKILELREQLSTAMTQATLEGQAAAYPVPGPMCPECQTEMRFKGGKANTVNSWVGTVRYERGYYYCDQCEAGLFPPGPPA